MLNAGASGPTKKQIDSAFGWSDSSDIFNQYKYLLFEIKESEDGTFTLLPINRLYIEKSVSSSLLQNYSNELATNFDADVEAVNFRIGDNSATVKQINMWIEEVTNKKIQNVLSSIASDVQSFLINTIYFKAKWSHPFNEKITEEPFYLDGKQSIISETMHVEEDLPYYENKDIELVKLPYASDKSRISMVIIKPKTRAGLSSLEKKLNYQFTEVSSWMNSVQYKLLDLSMPKFKFESGAENLKEILQSDFQVLKVFDASEADLSGISSSEDLFVSSIIHKSFISVDENGTEAAAATAIGVSATSIDVDIPLVVKINQPFMFLIYDEDNAVVLFVGRMVHPSSENDANKYLESRYSSGATRGAAIEHYSLLIIALMATVFSFLSTLNLSISI